MKITRLLLIPILLLTTGCGDGERVADVEDFVPEEVARARDEAPPPQANACELLTPSLLASHYGVAEAELEPTGKQMENFCAFRWKKPNYDQIIEETRQRVIEQSSERIEAMRRGETYQSPPMPRAENEVSISLAPGMKDRAQAERTFETIMNRMSKGITVQTTEETRRKVDETVREATGGRVSGAQEIPDSVTFQADVTSIEGIGDRAFWAPKLNQLTVMNGTTIFHLAVQISSDEAANLEEAKRLAPEIINRI